MIQFAGNVVYNYSNEYSLLVFSNFASHRIVNVDYGNIRVYGTSPASFDYKRYISLSFLTFGDNHHVSSFLQDSSFFSYWIQTVNIPDIYIPVTYDEEWQGGVIVGGKLELTEFTYNNGSGGVVVSGQADNIAFILIQVEVGGTVYVYGGALYSVRDNEQSCLTVVPYNKFKLFNHDKSVFIMLNKFCNNKCVIYSSKYGKKIVKLSEIFEKDKPNVHIPRR